MLKIGIYGGVWKSFNNFRKSGSSFGIIRGLSSLITSSNNLNESSSSSFFDWTDWLNVVYDDIISYEPILNNVDKINY
jgi:hypothetical protein